jgi:hypothetical protein
LVAAGALVAGAAALVGTGFALDAVEVVAVGAVAWPAPRSRPPPTSSWSEERSSRAPVGVAGGDVGAGGARVGSAVGARVGAAVGLGWPAQAARRSVSAAAASALLTRATIAPPG